MLAIADDAAAANFEIHLLVADYADAYTDDAAAAYYITYVADYDASDAAAAIADIASAQDGGDVYKHEHAHVLPPKLPTLPTGSRLPQLR